MWDILEGLIITNGRLLGVRIMLINNHNFTLEGQGLKKQSKQVSMQLHTYKGFFFQQMGNKVIFMPYISLKDYYA